MGDPDLLMRYRLCIFDADGTLRRTTVPGQPCPRREGEWELMPGVRQMLTQVAWGRPGAPQLGLASNQDQVAYGHLSLDTARELLRSLVRSAADIEPAAEALQLCPHTLETACGCRKPAPGMLHRLMRHYGVSPEETVFVGDSDADRAAAEAAGVAYLDARQVFGWGAAA